MKCKEYGTGLIQWRPDWNPSPSRVKHSPITTGQNKTNYLVKVDQWHRLYIDEGFTYIEYQGRRVAVELSKLPLVNDITEGTEWRENIEKGGK